jgi:hypothetical protein
MMIFLKIVKYMVVVGKEIPDLCWKLFDWRSLLVPTLIGGRSNFIPGSVVILDCFADSDL